MNRRCNPLTTSSVEIFVPIKYINCRKQLLQREEINVMIKLVITTGDISESIHYADSKEKAKKFLTEEQK